MTYQRSAGELKKKTAKERGNRSTRVLAAPVRQNKTQCYKNIEFESIT